MKEGDHYRITGQKIFITYGDHDLAENIVHLVLARTPDHRRARAGFRCSWCRSSCPTPMALPGRRNDVRCVSLEHKLGIHASPTAVLAFGDEEGAIGFLVGEEHRGMECMFTMMNNARLNVGVQGIAISERAYQQALEYARTTNAGHAGWPRCAAPIVWHPDVRRMLLLMRSRTEAARALAYLHRRIARSGRRVRSMRPSASGRGRARNCWCRW